MTAQIEMFGPVSAQAERDRTRKTTRPRGHAAPPGSGPKGETCRTCAHYTQKHHNDYVHRKCGLMQKHWTRGPGSDIRASDPACSKWEPEKPEAA